MSIGDTKPVTIGDIYKPLWTRFTADLKERGVKIAVGLEEAIHRWLKGTEIRTTNPNTASVHVKGMNPQIWQLFRAAALVKGLTLTEGVEEAIIYHFRVKEQEAVKNGGN